MRAFLVFVLAALLVVVILHDAPALARPLVWTLWIGAGLWTLSKTRMAARLAFSLIDAYARRSAPSKEQLERYGRMLGDLTLGPTPDVAGEIQRAATPPLGAGSAEEIGSAFVMPAQDEIFARVQNHVLGQARAGRRVLDAARSFLEEEEKGPPAPAKAGARTAKDDKPRAKVDPKCGVIVLIGASGTGKTLLAEAAGLELLGPDATFSISREDDDEAADALFASNADPRPLCVALDGFEGLGSSDSPCGAWLHGVLTGDWKGRSPPAGKRLVFVIDANSRISVADKPTSDTDPAAWEATLRRAVESGGQDLAPLLADGARLVERTDPHTNLGLAALAALRIREVVGRTGLRLAARGINADVLADCVRAAYGAFGGPKVRGEHKTMVDWIDARLEEAVKAYAKQSLGKSGEPVSISSDIFAGVNLNAAPAWMILPSTAGKESL